MKLFNAITPSNRHRSILIKKHLEKININNINYKIKNYTKKRYIEGIIIQKNNNIVEIDAGLERIIEISEKELNKIKKISKKEKTIGSKIKILLYKTETKKGDQLLNYLRIYKKLIINKNKKYKKYKLIKILMKNKKKYYKGIIVNTMYNNVGIGIGGIITYINND
jgi:hypothetical protein